MDGNIKKVQRFDVKVLESGQKGPYSDSKYHYIVTDIGAMEASFDEVKDFCKKEIHSAYESNEKPNPFVSEITSFRKIEDREYEYKVREIYTG